MKKAIVISLTVAFVIPVTGLTIKTVKYLQTCGAINALRQEASDEYWKLGFPLMQWAKHKAKPIVGEIPDEPGDDPQQYMARVLGSLEHWAAIEETRRPMAARDILETSSPYYSILHTIGMLGRMRDCADGCKTIEDARRERAYYEAMRATLAMAE